MTNTIQYPACDLQKYFVIAPMEGAWQERTRSLANLGGWWREVFIPKCSHRVGRLAMAYAAPFQLLKYVL